MTKIKLPTWANNIFLWLIIVSGAFYRFYNLNWDAGHWFHPDERNIAMAIGRIHFFTNLNPEFFAYNGFWIYLCRLTGEIFAVFNHNLAWLTDWGNVNLVTRLLSAIFSTLSIYLTFKVAQKLINTKAGLVAAAISAYTVGYIQYAHYGVTESLLVFWVLLICWLSLTRRWYLVTIVSALSVATKTSALSFFIIPIITWLVDFAHSHQRKHLLRQLIVLVPIFIVVIFISSPYSFLDWPKFKESMDYESGVVSGRLMVPYTLQFLHTQPYLFFLQNLLWHLNPLITLFGLLGLIIWLLNPLFTRKFSPAYPSLIFTLVYFGYVGSWYTKFIRYMLPIYPFLIISAVWLLFRLKEFSRPLYLTSMILVLTSSFAWSTAYLTVFEQPSTRITASQWLYTNTPPTSTFLTEHWDDHLPVNLLGYSNKFNFIELTNYDPDSISKIAKLAQSLAKGDYLILSSRRLRGSIGKAPQQYPLTSRYYQLLFQEKLGYVLVKKFSVYPHLGPLIITDDPAEETFQVYDHPTVLIYQNISHLSPTDIQVILNPK